MNTTSIEELRSDFQKVAGYPFEHFYCPILQRDEPAELCAGHVVNKAFFDTSNKSEERRILQRKDVDNFYGSHFESRFTLIEKMEQIRSEGWTASDLLGDAKLPKGAVKIFRGETEIPSFITKGVPNISCLALPVGQPEENKFLGLKMDVTDIKSGQEIYAETEINIDIRVELLVSLLKAAHLSLFYQLGYEYAYRSSGRFMGAILADFYNEHKKKSRDEVRQGSLKYFLPYVHMVRPITEISFETKGTALDGHTFLVMGSSGRYWAMIVLVKTPTTTHSVLVPTAETHEDVGTFWNFLHNDRCNIHATHAVFNKNEQKWEVAMKASPFFWKKEGANFDPMTRP